jgi:uncharacterized SAM-binding protein YcdF (DUF218 family)
MQTLIDEALERRAKTRMRWEETLRRVYRRTRSRAALVIVALLTAYLLIFETNALWWAAEPLKFSAPPERADAIVVFAGGVGESGKAGGGAQERLKQAVDLYKAGYAQYLILSSGYVYSFHEAEAMRALAVDQGIPAGSIVLETHSTNTYQNVQFVTEILRDHKWRRILLVSSPYHMRRALKVWAKQAPESTVIPTPASVSRSTITRAVRRSNRSVGFFRNTLPSSPIGAADGSEVNGVAQVPHDQCAGGSRGCAGGRLRYRDLGEGHLGSAEGPTRILPVGCDAWSAARRRLRRMVRGRAGPHQQPRAPRPA